MNKSKYKFSRNAKLYLCALFFFYISMGAFSMLQGLYIKELRMDEKFLGDIIALKTAAIAICAIPCSAIVNKFGKKKGIFMAMFFVPIAIILQGLFVDKIALVIFSIFQGAMNAFLSVSESPFFMENTTEKNRISLFSFSFADNVFSTMIGYFGIGGISSTLNNGMKLVQALKYSIILAGMLGILSCVFILRIKENIRIEQPKNEKYLDQFIRGVIKVFSQKNSLNFLIYNAIIGFGAGLVVPYFNVYLKYRVNASPWQIGIIMGLAQGAMGIGGIITPFLAQRFGRVKTIIICQIISIPFLMLIALPSYLIVISIALFIRNALMNMTGPITGNLSMEMVDKYERPIFSGVNNLCGNLSRALSAVVAGYIMSNFANGYELPYFFTAILYIIATLQFYFAFRNFDNKKLKIKELPQ